MNISKVVSLTKQKYARFLYMRTNQNDNAKNITSKILKCHFSRFPKYFTREKMTKK